MRHSRAQLLVHLFGLVVVWLAAGCESEVSRATRLVLVSDTDISELDRVTFDITPPAGDPQQAEASISPGAPAWVVMERGENASSGPYEITVTGRDDDGVSGAITRSATVSFQAEKTLVVPLHLEASCGSACARITQRDLVPWTGAPPTLSGAPPLDGGPGEAGVRDAGMHDDGGSLSDGGDTCDPNSCINGELVLCAGGIMTGTMACPAPSTCETASCVAGEGCVAEPASGGACGTGLTCMDGVCGLGQTCANDLCHCDDGAASCELSCAPGANPCDLRCPAGAECEFRCGGADKCEARCAAGASCILHCEGQDDCSFRPGNPGCPGGALTCPNDVIVCNTACPE